MPRIRRRLLNDGWRFHWGQTTTPVGEAVTLPHSWNALDEMERDPAYHFQRGGGWYVRDLASADLPAAPRRLWLEVEAAAMRAAIWLDDQLIGSHEGGYTGFAVELPTWHDDTTRQLRIWVDNAPDIDLIPSAMADFFLAGGLTRNVWLAETGPTRIATVRCATTITTAAATVVLSGRCEGAAATLTAELRDPAGTLVARGATPTDGATYAITLGPIAPPLLWSPDHPHRYTLTLTAVVDDNVTDTLVERMGLRTFAFPASGPFLLNGSPLRLIGTQRHEDWAGLASAVPDALTRQELQLIRDAGFNFLRLGHYPQAPAVLDACDELGLIVWEELPWCRGGIGGAVFQERARRMLVEMIEQHDIHPSIVFWGLGNELDWESEHPDSTDERVAAFLQELHDLTHALDPHRLTALRRFEPGASVVDVYSPSIWSGWYRGRYEDYGQALTEAQSRFPHLLHIEWGADNHVGRHGEGPHIPTAIAQESDHAERPGVALSAAGPPRASRDGDWSESYALDLMEWHLQVQARQPNFAGGAQWVFKDFATPLRPENPLPYINQKGLLTRDGQLKDSYFLFQSYLTTAPMCYIESPTWLVRVGPADAPQRVRVYSNCPRVTLFLNGVGVGERARDPLAFPAAGLVWHVPFTPGKNELRAVALATDGCEVTHTIIQNYVVAVPGPGSAFTWEIAPVTTTAGAPGLRVTAQLVDATGCPVVTDARRVTFGTQGDCCLVANLGTSDGSRQIALANGRASIVAIPGEHDSGAVTISADDLSLQVLPLVSASRREH